MQTENYQFGFNRRKQRKQSYLLPLLAPVQKTLLLCIASCCNVAQAQCYIDPVTKEQICTPVSSSAHCRITVADGSTGSGTLVRRTNSLGLVLTCAHLFDNATGRIIVTFTNGQRFAARLVERDRAHDLAALLIRRSDAEPITVSDEEPSGVLSACGYGPDGQLRCFRGDITGAAIAAGAVYPSLTIAGAGQARRQRRRSSQHTRPPCRRHLGPTRRPHLRHLRPPGARFFKPHPQPTRWSAPGQGSAVADSAGGAVA